MTLAATGQQVQPRGKGPGVSAPKTLNRSTGRESTWETGFRDSTWGSASRDYTQRASNLSQEKIDVIVKEAQLYITRRPPQVQISSNTNEHACLVDDSDSDSGADEDCKSSSVLFARSSNDLCNQKCAVLRTRGNLGALWGQRVYIETKPAKPV